ncbi:hypothetical protein LOCC1_G002693 [Lachnellula occidentalis]|uniref:F-box domain-containing protein n=1 Tax=Lachnellula occidentalis TaxID=215460 RepID=A0A8H8S310_9HELO|nr:hypothetical protein LOCC1_G002693 [Lachnellula occidentalis]
MALHTYPPTSLDIFPDELLLTILSHLDIPDLPQSSPSISLPAPIQEAILTPPTHSLSTTRTSHRLRTLSFDPLLHTTRLHRASTTLSHSLPLRPSLAQLMAHRIYITRTTLAARHLGRNLIKIKLNRSLLKRPSQEELVGRGVLPRECVVGGLAPGLVEVKRRVERERVKDTLREWVGEWRTRGWERRRGEEVRPDVGRLVRRFARDKEGGRNSGRWGRSVERQRQRQREEPTRAKVLGLKRFWEKVGKEGVGS